jgi:hypothetical protein
VPSISEFKWKEMFNNSNGKTSGMLFVCIIACFNSAMTFSVSALIIFGASIYGMIFKINLPVILPPDITSFLSNIMMQSVAMFGLGATGLGVRRFTQDKNIIENQQNTE